MQVTVRLLSCLLSTSLLHITLPPPSAGLPPTAVPCRPPHTHPGAAPSPLVGLTGARPALKSARLTTTLSQEGLAGLAGPSGAAATAAAGRGASSRSAPLQKPGAAKAGGKRALEALGQPSAAAAKRQKATKPLSAAGGRPGRKAPGAAAAAAAAGLGEGGTLDESQGLSLHGLLQSAQRRAAEATQPTQEDRWGQLHGQWQAGFVGRRGCQRCNDVLSEQ